MEKDKVSTIQALGLYDGHTKLFRYDILKETCTKLVEELGYR
jgi:hypothetical protein